MKKNTVSIHFVKSAIHKLQKQESDIKEILLSEIHEVSINYEKYCNNPKRDFSRKRKLPFELMLKTS